MEKTKLRKVLLEVLRMMEYMRSHGKSFDGLCRWMKLAAQRCNTDPDIALLTFREYYQKIFPEVRAMQFSDYYYSFGVGNYTKYPGRWFSTPDADDEYITPARVEEWYDIRKKFVEEWIINLAEQ